MIIQDLISYQTHIDSAIKSFNDPQQSEDDLPFLFDEDLDRYCVDLALERIKFIKKNMKSLLENIHHPDLSINEFILITSVKTLIDTYPEEFHKCIGCPCREFEYPNCYICPFLSSCQLNVPVYPTECSPSNCSKMFMWTNQHLEIILRNMKRTLPSQKLADFTEYNCSKNMAPLLEERLYYNSKTPTKLQDQLSDIVKYYKDKLAGVEKADLYSSLNSEYKVQLPHYLWDFIISEH